MDIATVKAMKAKLEADIRRAAGVLVDDFQQATGVTVTNVSVDLVSTQAVGGARNSCVSGCSVDVEI